MQNKILKKVICCALAVAGTLACATTFTACETNTPEAQIVLSFNGKTYTLNYEMNRKITPKTVAHFIALADAGYYNGLCVHDYKGSKGLYTGAYTYAEGDLVAKDYFSIGDKIKMVTPTTAFVDNEIVLQVYGFNHYRLSNGTDFAHVVFGMVGVMNAYLNMNNTNTNIGGWAATKMRTYLNETVYPALPMQWQNMIKTVDVLSSEGNTSAVITSSENKLFLFSGAEVGYNVTTVPYCNEVDTDAEEVTFGVFTDSTSRIKKRYNGTGEATNWWLRSPSSIYGSVFACVSSTGIVGTGTSGSAGGNNFGISFGFCI